MEVVIVPYLVDVVVSTWAGWTSRQWLITFWFAKAILGHSIKFCKTGLFVITWIGITRHSCFQEEALPSVFIDFRATQALIVLLDTIVVRTRTRQRPRAISSLNKLVVDACDAVADFFKVARGWRVIKTRTWFSALFKWTCCYRVSEQLRIDIWLSISRKLEALCPFWRNWVASRSGSSLIIVLKSWLFATWPARPLALLRSRVRPNRVVVVGTGHKFQCVIVNKLSLAGLFTHRVGSRELNLGNWHISRIN